MKKPQIIRAATLVMRSEIGRTAVHTVEEIPAGGLIVPLEGPRQDRPSKYSIQIDESVHVEERGLIDGELNHSCHPNAFVDVSEPTRPAIRALREIPAGSEITIDYCASEEDMTEPFTCHCGEPECYGLVRGYAHLTTEQRQALRGYAAPFLLRKYEDR